MAAFTKFNDFVEEVLKGSHNFNADTFKALLSNVAPAASNTVKADLTEISTGSGYVAGGPSLTVTLSRTSGTAKVVVADKIITASGGSIGPFRYVSIYNDTAAGDPLVGFSDKGSSITLTDGESYTIDFDAAAGLFTFA